MARPGRGTRHTRAASQGAQTDVGGLHPVLLQQRSPEDHKLLSRAPLDLVVLDGAPRSSGRAQPVAVPRVRGLRCHGDESTEPADVRLYRPT